MEILPLAVVHMDNIVFSILLQLQYGSNTNYHDNEYLYNGTNNLKRV